MVPQPVLYSLLPRQPLWCWSARNACQGRALVGEAGHILVDVCYIHAEAERNLEDVESIPVVADRTPGEVSRNLAGEVHILVGAVHILVGAVHSLVGVGHSLGVIDKVVVCPITVNQHT